MKKLGLVLLFFILLSACGPRENNEGITAPVDQDSLTNMADTSQDNSFGLESFQQLVDQYEDPERSTWQNPEVIIDKVGALKGLKVADIGAGTGYFSFRLAAKGAAVVAVDIDQRFLDYIEERKSEVNETIANQVETRLTEEDDPLLDESEVDAVLLVNTYYFLTDRVDYLTRIKKGLKQDGKLIIVDYKQEEMPVGPTDDYKISIDEIIAELSDAGFVITEMDLENLKYQYIIVAKKK